MHANITAEVIVTTAAAAATLTIAGNVATVEYLVCLICTNPSLGFVYGVCREIELVLSFRFSQNITEYMKRLGSIRATQPTADNYNYTLI